MLRDISERGRDLESVLAQYITFVKPAFEEFCLPVGVSLHVAAYVVAVPPNIKARSDVFSFCRLCLDKEVCGCDYTTRSRQPW